MKSHTDKFWSRRAGKVPAGKAVNILDTCQREMEYDYICRYFEPAMRILEVGCGNGYSTALFRGKVRWVDALDYSAEMVERAKKEVGETNNRFFRDDILAPELVEPPYDLVLCVRVLINLKDFEQQKTAIDRMAGLLEPGGKLLLVEGFAEGFEALSRLRQKVGMTPLQPNKINFYSHLNELLPHLERAFVLRDTFHLGSFDYLTRFVYPHLAGPDKVRHNSPMAAKMTELARAFNPAGLDEYSRVRGLLLEKR
ncbi:MAG TPA: class I SAM-dependent methyltransferase [Candidatus Glassbacteria bacterium]|nr:class I SAM-dependent methyltransferase [Candidatus Glassbacteria bacterium]